MGGGTGTGGGTVRVYFRPDELKRGLHELKTKGATAENPLLCTRLGGGVLRFAEVLFDGAAADTVFAEVIEREAEGIGPHFDVYQNLIDPMFPWIGVYNLAGSATLRATVLPADLTESYRQSFPTHTKTAYDARRHYSALALQISEHEAVTHRITANNGLVIPQTESGLPTVHEVVPEDKSNPGQIIKIFKGRDSTGAKEARNSMGIDTLDAVVTAYLGGNVNITNSDPASPGTVASRLPRDPEDLLEPGGPLLPRRSSGSGLLD